MLRRRFTVMRSSPALHRAQASAPPNVWQFAVVRSVDPLRGNSNQVFSLLRHRRVVDNVIGKRAPPGE